MEKQCRAKNPSTCRVHGSYSRSLPISEITDNDHLTEIADNASASGDVELFIQAKAQMEKNNREAAASALAPSANEVSQMAGEAAAKARYKSESYMYKWKSLPAEQKAGLAKLEQEVLAVAVPYMSDGVLTDEAVTAMAMFRENRFGSGRWDRYFETTQEKFKEKERISLEAAAPHMGISVGAKASFRNLFRNVEETVHAGIEEISEHHEQEIPPEIGGSTVAWSDMNPFKSPFKNGRLR